MALVVGDSGGTVTPTPNVTAGSNPRQTLFMGAAPNVSRDGQPLQFVVELEKPASLVLKLFDVVGEKVFEESSRGNTGLNAISWRLENDGGDPVASGLYIYVLSADDGTTVRIQRGKVVVLR